jgi:hypothetical protein
VIATFNCSGLGSVVLTASGYSNETCTGTSVSGYSTLSATYTSGTVVTATETPASSGTSLASWDTCTGNASTCSITVNGNQESGATFIQNYPTLPAIWVDNNELTCKAAGNCLAGSPGLSLTSAQYEYMLGTGWVTGPPPSGTYHSPYTDALGTPYNTTCSGLTVGLQGAVCDFEAAREAYGYGFIIDIPAASTNAIIGTTDGLVLPKIGTTAATSPIILRSTSDASLLRS